jgi:hypothetical protein
MKRNGLLLALFPLLAMTVCAAKKPEPMDLVYEAEKGNVALIYSGAMDGLGHLNIRNAGSGFLTKDGLVITANHVVGTASGLLMSYKNVHYMMKPLYKDHANDIAFIYPIAAGGTRIGYDHLQGLSTLEIKEAKPKENQELILIGFPKGLVQNEPKRTLGRFKAVHKDRYMPGVDLYECDLPVMEGFSGGPVFTQDRQLAGMAISFENQPNSAPYLITYVTPAQNLLRKIKTLFTKENMDKIKEIEREVPSFDIGPDNCPPLRDRQREVENMSEAVVANQVCLTKKSAYGAASFFCQDNVKAANVILDFMAQQEERGSGGASQQFDLYVKYLNPSNYVSVRFDFDKNRALMAYAKDGQVQERNFMVDMPVVANSFYNLEVFTVGERMGVYFDNLPVYYDNNLPISSGRAGLAMAKGARIILPKEEFHIRLPKDY